MLASAAFSGAERASSFLRMVVLRALSGRVGEIKESVIAVEALARSPSFDSKSDSIVSVEARRFRDRLDSFYRNEGAADPIVIALPTGRCWRWPQVDCLDERRLATPVETRRP